MKALFRKSALLLPILLVSALAASSSFAQSSSLVKTMGYALEANDVHVEVTIGEASDADGLSTSIDGLTAEIEKDHAINPEAFFEAGWLSFDHDGRNPAQVQKIVSKAQNFVSTIVQKLKSKNIETDQAAGIQLPKARLAKKDSWYLNHSRLVWTLIRVSNSTGFRIGSMLFAGLSLSHSVELSSTLALACTLSAAFYIPINHFSNKVRFYNSLDLNKYPRLKKLLSNPATANRIERIHGKINWGMVEVAFGSTIVFGENFARKMLGLPVELPSLLQFGMSTGMAIATQQVWDRAVSKYEDLQNLLHEQAGGDLKDILFVKQKNADVYKLGAIGSVMSVVGFSWSSSQNLGVKITGYGILGALGVAGRVYEHRIDAKLARILSQINGCNAILGGNLPDAPLDPALDQAG